MKKTFLLILVLIAAFGANAQSDNKPEIKFDKTTIDLGKIGADSPVRSVSSYSRTREMPTFTYTR